MAVQTWVRGNGSVGGFYGGANWSGGIAPVAGDTVTIGAIGGQLSDATIGTDTVGGPGAVVAGLTINLAGSTLPNGNAGTQLRLNHNVFASNTVLNTSGAAVLQASNPNVFAGQVNVGVGAPGTLELEMLPATDPMPGNAALFDANLGTMTINGGSQLYINPFTGGFNGRTQSPFAGYFNFYNLGTVNVAPGGTLLDENKTILTGGIYNTDFINDGVVTIQGKAGQDARAEFDANVRSSTSFVNALDTRLGASIPASGNTQGLITLEGGTGRARATFTGNVSDQAIRAHNATVTFAESQESNQPRVWGGRIDLRGNATVAVQGNFAAPATPIGAQPGDPDYTQSMSDLNTPIYNFDSTDALASETSGAKYAQLVWTQATHRLEIREGATPDAANAVNNNLNGYFILDGTWSRSDFTLSYTASDSFSGYWTITTTNDTYAPGYPLFDRSYYLAHNPDVAALGVDPYQHYLDAGWKEARNPNAYFDTSYYLAHNPDIAAAGVNPMLHYLANGWRENRDPSAAFSLADYRAANPDVAAAGVDPLAHYLVNGRAEGRAAYAVGPAPEPGFDAAYYYAHNPDVAAAGLDAYAHYAALGWKEGRAPDALFDPRYYLAQNPDVAAARIDPLAHFLANGWREGRDPSLLFSGAKYLAAYRDVAAAGVDPLLHYLANGRAEGRMAFLAGGSAPADPLVDAGFYDRQLGATLLPTGAAAAQQAAASYAATGWQRGLNPDALFDTAYYLSHNPDVAAAHISPLLHYELYGWKEGHDPSAAFSTGKYLAAYHDVAAAGVNPLLHYVANGQAEGRSAFHV